MLWKIGVFVFTFWSSTSFAEDVKHTMTWGSGNRCSVMCDAYRKQADGYCKVYGYAGGSAKDCSCDEQRSNPQAFGTLACTGKLPADQLAVEAKTKLNGGERCSQGATRFEKEATRFCNAKGYRVGIRVTDFFCDELGNNNGWAVMLCKNPNPKVHEF